MNISKSEMTKFLIKHNYILQILKDENSKFIICKYNDNFWAYGFEQINEDYIYLYITSENKYEAIIIDRFMLRLYISIDLLRFCRLNNLSYNIIKCFDSNQQEVDINSLIEIELNSKELEKEKELSKGISVLLKDRKLNQFDQHYYDINLYHKWNILKGLLV